MAKPDPALAPVTGSAPFLLCSSYRTRAGRWVRIIDESTVKGYECVKGDDGIWRYNRENDRGRVTGSPFDMSDPRNLKPNTVLSNAAPTTKGNRYE